MTSARPTVTLLDYGAGNVRSIRNAIDKLGYDIHDVTTVEDITNAEKLVFPGVGAFGAAVAHLKDRGLFTALQKYIADDRPFLGICIGMQVLFEGSDEAPGVPGLGIVPGRVTRFAREQDGDISVPHIGWNGVRSVQHDSLFTQAVAPEERVYFVHSYRALPVKSNEDWVLTLTDYGKCSFVSSIHKGRVVATQFHPEKSARTGLNLIGAFLRADATNGFRVDPADAIAADTPRTQLSKRIIACLDVRENDDGDLVVTKGDQYDVRESSTADTKGKVRNLGKPVELAQRYYEEGADEVTFLNITAFRSGPIEDMPMLAVLQETSKNVFVPLTIGGGIRDYKDPDSGVTYTALQVAAEYFRSGADKVSIGSDAVRAASRFFANDQQCDGSSSIEAISKVYGAQAVVVSVDPRRVYAASADDVDGHRVYATSRPGPNDERFCWYQCMVKGGREASHVDAVQLAVASEALGAGEILLNCVDMDGQKQGYDHELIRMVRDAVSIPVIASSGAGSAQHFVDVFAATDAEAALAAGIFHRREVPISEVKQCLLSNAVPVRLQQDNQD